VKITQSLRLTSATGTMMSNCLSFVLQRRRAHDGSPLASVRTQARTTALLPLRPIGRRRWRLERHAVVVEFQQLLDRGADHRAGRTVMALLHLLEDGFGHRRRQRDTERRGAFRLTHRPIMAQRDGRRRAPLLASWPAAQPQSCPASTRGTTHVRIPPSAPPRGHERRGGRVSGVAFAGARVADRHADQPRLDAVAVGGVAPEGRAPDATRAAPAAATRNRPRSARRPRTAATCRRAAPRWRWRRAC
jgi:hypothetical protein